MADCHRRKPRDLRRPVLSLAVVLILLASSATFADARPKIAPKSAMALFSSHISHIVFLMQENRAFDNLYGVYCPSTGVYCPDAAAGIPPHTCVSKVPGSPTQGCFRPFNLTIGQVPFDLQHDWWSSHSAWNNGAMNNFYAAEGSKLTFGHYNGSTIPLYYDLAEQYGLADNFFSGSQSYSLSEHWYMFASLPPAASIVNYIGWNTAVDHLYLNESNATKSAESTLLNSSVSWKYYDYGLPPWYNRSIGGSSPLPATGLDYWNPLAARAESYLSNVRPHFATRANFFTDAVRGQLPNVSWIIPAATDSDHAPYSLAQGMNWTASVVDALEQSPDWNSTVLFVTWDEYGGFYDHVAPPYLDSYGDGFRVPLLAIGPWVKQGVVDHQNLSFSSILHLMEVRFNLACTGPRDCKAQLPLGMFDFSRMRARLPIGFPTNGTASYPMPLQSGGKLPPYAPYPGFQPNYDPTTGPPPPNAD
jgi:phospholipase C